MSANSLVHIRVADKLAKLSVEIDKGRCDRRSHAIDPRGLLTAFNIRVADELRVCSRVRFALRILGRPNGSTSFLKTYTSSDIIPASYLHISCSISLICNMAFSLRKAIEATKPSRLRLGLGALVRVGAFPRTPRNRLTSAVSLQEFDGAEDFDGCEPDWECENELASDLEQSQEEDAREEETDVEGEQAEAYEQVVEYMESASEDEDEARGEAEDIVVEAEHEESEAESESDEDNSGSESEDYNDDREGTHCESERTTDSEEGDTPSDVSDCTGEFTIYSTAAACSLKADCQAMLKVMQSTTRSQETSRPGVPGKHFVMNYLP